MDRCLLRGGRAGVDSDIACHEVGFLVRMCSLVLSNQPTGTRIGSVARKRPAGVIARPFHIGGAITEIGRAHV